MTNDPLTIDARTYDAAMDNLSEDVHAYFLADEQAVVESLLEKATMSPDQVHEAQQFATNLIESIRSRLSKATGLHALLSYYDLSSREGIVLMCLAEALLRIPDDDTVDALIADKLASGQWHQHLGKSESFFVNASTWALLLTGRLLKPKELDSQTPESFFSGIAERMEESVLRAAIRHAMRIIAEQYVLGSDIRDALQRSQRDGRQDYRYSFDMLGEAALTSHDATRYQQAYLEAIQAIGDLVDHSQPIMARHSISIKLSALFPRYEFSQWPQAENALTETLLLLAGAAREAGVAVTVDAEEADRLAMSLRIFARVFSDQALAGWGGLGLAVQAYQKRALPVLAFLNELAAREGKQIPVRLVKGAYWDTEIKRAQQQGLRDYPVFTRKNNTDLSYLACARYLLDSSVNLYPQFATHNAYTLASIVKLGEGKRYEFQRLQGMGEELYSEVLETHRLEVPCRIYAPVGVHADLLPYLVRRLLENGANTSFINQLAHPDEPVEQMVIDPVARARALEGDFRHPDVPIPQKLFGCERLNSYGVNFHDACEVKALLDDLQPYLEASFHQQPMIGGQQISAESQPVSNPADTGKVVGYVEILGRDQIYDLRQAIDIAYDGWEQWCDTAVNDRAECLLKAADLFEMHQTELIALCVKEAGKNLRDSQAEIREAVDFLRYYAVSAKQLFAEPLQLPGFTGETNALSFKGRGIFACISPWNFPVAIFCGQIAAALVAGNSVLAKPASAACLVAGKVVELFYEAGVPATVLQFVPAKADVFSETVLADARVAGVAFTGSTQTAWEINRALAAREAPIATLVAETGGQNAMLADSSTLPEQLVKDVLQSSFNSAGQRCSALRVLYVQEEIATRVIELITGAMEQLQMGDPCDPQTDVGPVISADAKHKLEAHIRRWKEQGRLLYQCPLPQTCKVGNFVAPALIELSGIEQLEAENFGPVLHLVRYSASQLEAVLDAVKGTNYGLTFGVHSRIEQRVAAICEKMPVGNLYVNRDMVGAVVGVQPFGGCRFSGTGPKAGGPHYLLAFASEQTLTTNTAAAGGNALLLGQLK